jgi:hypothetical protein
MAITCSWLLARSKNISKEEHPHRDPSTSLRSVEKHSQEGTAEPQISLLRSPGFPVETRGVDQHHAVFLRKTAHVVVASSAKEEIRVRFGRDDKGEGGVSIDSRC